MRILSRLGNHYAWASPDYVLKKMSWNQVMAYYEHCIAHLNNKEIEYEEEQIPLLNIPGVVVMKDGTRVYNR